MASIAKCTTTPAEKFQQDRPSDKGNDSSTKNSGAKDFHVKDSTVKDSVAKASPVKDCSLKVGRQDKDEDSSAKASESKASKVKNVMSKDSEVKSSASKDSHVHDSAAKALHMTYSTAQGNRAKDSAPKASALKDSQIKDSRAKDVIVEDSSSKVSAVKDSGKINHEASPKDPNVGLTEEPKALIKAELEAIPNDSSKGNTASASSDSPVTASDEEEWILINRKNEMKNKSEEKSVEGNKGYEETNTKEDHKSPMEASFHEGSKTPEEVDSKKSIQSPKEAGTKEGSKNPTKTGTQEGGKSAMEVDTKEGKKSCKESDTKELDSSGNDSYLEGSESEAPKSITSDACDRSTDASITDDEQGKPSNRKKQKKNVPKKVRFVNSGYFAVGESSEPTQDGEAASPTAEGKNVAKDSVEIAPPLAKSKNIANDSIEVVMPPDEADGTISPGTPFSPAEPKHFLALKHIDGAKENNLKSAHKKSTHSSEDEKPGITVIALKLYNLEGKTGCHVTESKTAGKFTATDFKTGAVTVEGAASASTETSRSPDLPDAPRVLNNKENKAVNKNAYPYVTLVARDGHKFILKREVALGSRTVQAIVETTRKFF